MTDRLLLDIEEAFKLVQHEQLAASAIRWQRPAIFHQLVEATRLLNVESPPSHERLGQIERDLDAAAQRLGKRVSIVGSSGADINAGLGATRDFGRHFEAIETRGGKYDADGYASVDDLKWAVDNLHGEARDAADWLLKHPEFFNAVSGAADDTDYLDDPYRSRFTEGHSAWPQLDGGISLSDLHAFDAHLEAWATLRPQLASIDIAAKGGDADATLSKEDFEAFLASADLPDDVRAAVEQVLADEAFNSSGFEFIDFLDLVSFVPVVGDFVDAGLALYYFSQGDYASAIAHGLGLMPIPGLSGGALKTAREAGQYLGKEGLQKAAGHTAANASASVIADVTADATGNEWVGMAASAAVRTRTSSIGAGPDFDPQHEFARIALNDLVKSGAKEMADYAFDDDLDNHLELFPPDASDD